MKRHLSLSLVLCLLLSRLYGAASASAVTGECGDSCTWSLIDSTLTISAIYLKPLGCVTRCQVAAILNRYCNLPNASHT